MALAAAAYSGAECPVELLQLLGQQRQLQQHLLLRQLPVFFFYPFCRSTLDKICPYASAEDAVAAVDAPVIASLAAPIAAAMWGAAWNYRLIKQKPLVIQRIFKGSKKPVVHAGTKLQQHLRLQWLLQQLCSSKHAAQSRSSQPLSWQRTLHTNSPQDTECHTDEACLQSMLQASDLKQKILDRNITP